ncbi:MAG: hypothetical protein G01um101430_204 [Parcubacteria group bacterium Gr01-1014_30]|nr:MAG: hypothetical protein G01um101430_204 [Parcubacteria group bacterium Gr01-1014_30]
MSKWGAFVIYQQSGFVMCGYDEERRTDEKDWLERLKNPTNPDLAFGDRVLHIVEVSLTSKEGALLRALIESGSPDGKFSLREYICEMLVDAYCASSEMKPARTKPRHQWGP